MDRKNKVRMYLARFFGAFLVGLGGFGIITMPFIVEHFNTAEAIGMSSSPNFAAIAGLIIGLFLLTINFE